MRLIIDAQLPPAFAEALRNVGCDAVAVRDLGLQRAKDAEIWLYAKQHGDVIVTKDEDFAERCLSSTAPPVVIWLRIGNATNASLISWFLPMWPAVRQRIEAGDKLVEVR